ncbi:MAG: proline dehydrogenase family protein [Candidatus Tyrphobacter sp.]
MLSVLARRFVAGTTIEAAIAAVRALNARGMTASLDFLGEDVSDRGTAEKTTRTYIGMLDAIRDSGIASNVSVKLTAIGVLVDRKLALSNLLEILERARTNPDPFVRIDMEGSALTQTTLDLFEEAFSQRDNVGIVLQAYLKRTPGDVQRALALRARVRLCKGAYKEPPAIALASMDEIRAQYLPLAKQLLLGGTYPGIATHDRRLLAEIEALTAAEKIEKTAFEFQMLYGCRPTLQRELVAKGYRMRVYVPFGTHWAGYFYRRVAERRENLLFALSSIFGR